MRPLYETQEDLNREDRFARVLENLWKCKFVKLPIKYHIDYVLTRNDLAVAFCEIKTRNYTWDEIDKMGGYLISIDKWSSAECLHRISRLPFLLVVKASDGLYYSSVIDFKPDSVLVRGRTDRNDWQDIEPCVLLKTNRFTRLAS